MEFTNDILKKMYTKKKAYNVQYGKWYYGMSQENIDIQFIKKIYENKSERIINCLNLWQWDRYEKNKILDLQQVNRCNNNRFCPNCKLLDISKFIHSFRKIYEEYTKLGYKAYMLTLTIPSVKGEELRDTLDLLSKNFHKFIQKYSYDINDKKSYSDRLLQIDGGIKVLEITYNSLKGFHPHYHCVVFSKDNIDPLLLDKKIKGKYSNKRNEYNYKSYIDLQLGQLWSMIWYKERLNRKNINTIVYDPKETYLKKDNIITNMKCLEVDFVELDELGIYEVFKYTFKDSDIKNYYVFKTLVTALDKKRIRQGFGILYNLQCEDIDEGELQDLDLEIKENPTSLLTYEIKELITTYRSYKKISRFNRQIDNNIKS